MVVGTKSQPFLGSPWRAPLNDRQCDKDFIDFRVTVGAALLKDHSGRAMPVSHIPASWTNQKFGLYPAEPYDIQQSRIRVF